MPKITIVVAMNEQNVIGVNNSLPWHIPEDLKYFKQVTYGKPVIMGRKTYESIGRLLPGRKNIIVSRSSDLDVPGAFIYNSLEKAIKDNQEFPELCIIGGGEIFKQALSITEELHLTVIDYPVENPTVYFPQLNLSEWNLVETKDIVSESGVKCQFNVYRRRHTNEH